jgi:putative transposase
MRERGLLVRSRRLRARRKKEWGRVEATQPNQIWQSDMTKIWAGPVAGGAYLVSVIDCCTREIVGWNLSHRCRTEDALAAVEQAVLVRLPAGSREANLTLTTDNARSSLLRGSWKRSGGSGSRIAARRFITRKATVISSGSIAA